MHFIRKPDRIALRRKLFVSLGASLLGLGATGAIAKPRSTRKVNGATANGPNTASLLKRDDVREFIAMMQSKHGFDPFVLRRVLAGATYSDTALKLVTPVKPTGARVWSRYRARFSTDLHIDEGVKFWDTHQAALAQAAAQYGVPEEVIVAIIGVETIYGRNQGGFRALDVLLTLAFDDPRRAAFFRDELEQLLLFCRESGLNPIELKSSYAGAIGLGQFMPSSLRKWAVDFDRDGKIDLRGSPVDAIGSVANFLAVHGWVAGAPTHFVASLDAGANVEPPLSAGIEPQLSIADLRGYGVRSDTPIDPNLALALIDLPNGDEPTIYALGARNFYVVTRYNRSSFYAMSVIELAQTLRARRPSPPSAVMARSSNKATLDALPGQEQLD